MAKIPVSPEIRPRNQFGRYISTIQAGGEAALEEIRELMEKNAKMEAPRVTGKLRASTVAVRRGNKIVGSTVGIKYAAGVHDGNPPHVIRSKSRRPDGLRKPLANTWASNTPNDPGFFAPSGEVQHPGNQPYPYLKMAYELTWPHAMDIVDANID